MSRFSDTLPVGVVIERRRLSNPWADAAWAPVEVVPGAPELDGTWTELSRTDTATRWYAGTLELLAHRRETASYRQNLDSGDPRVWVVLRRDGEEPHPWRPILATCAPDMAQHAMEVGEDIVESVPMPEVVFAWLADFIEAHHIEVTPYKRKRLPHKGAPEPSLPVGAPDTRAKR